MDTKLANFESRPLPQDFDVEYALLNPSAGFKRPLDVVKSKKIDIEQKIKILRQWSVDCRALVRAADEGMPGEAATSLLDEVQKARKQLGDDDILPNE